MQLLTVSQAARRLGVCKATIYRLVKRGELSALKVGRATRLRAGDIDDFIDRQAAKGLS